ncbi:MAG: ATP-dependent Clp protease ATP-binding subunit [Clostridia bacterium]|nr:ATP-dependent Clp protease ATP-binding subunit [Clostridia bacterium]
MNISGNLKRILDFASRAASNNPQKVAPIHLLYGCSLTTDSLACAILNSEGITADVLAKTPPAFFADKNVNQVLNMAETQSMVFNQPEIYSEALLYVLCSQCKQSQAVVNKINPGAAQRILQKVILAVEDTDMEKLAQTRTTIQPVKPVSLSTVVTTAQTQVTSVNSVSTNTATNDELSPLLLEYGQDLTAKARQGKIDRIIGRDEETDRLIEILCRKTKNNPVLIGEAGVGKSAIIEGLAKRIVEQKVPDNLLNKIVYSLDIGLILGGSKYRGELEGRLNKVLQELKERDDIILFIDEIHNIVTSGNKEGEMSVAEILKPVLARGTLRCVGATTIDEYRLYIEKDPALERRFDPVMVYPPTLEQTVEILEGLQPSFENYHHVQINHSALKAAVLLSNRYIFDRNLPDKAIDVLDKACAKARIKSGHNLSIITENEIAVVVAEITKIPLNKINAHDQKNLMNLEKDLQAIIIGQDKAISAVAKAVRRNRSGINDANRPIGSFFFLGRTGVGKTEVCKQLSQILYDTEKAFIKLDMSEFSEAHSVSKIVGAPPGYVGYDDGSNLCNRVRRNPYCLVLFDEIEKAHADIYNLMLQILDEGRLTDSHGKVVSFRNAIIVMTSNVGVGEIPTDHEVSLDEEEQYIMNGMRKKFSPEFINRIDNIVVFNTLTQTDIEKIVAIQMKKLTKRLAAVNVSMQYTDPVITWLAVHGYQKNYGVRPIRRLMQTQIEDKISEQIITEQIHFVEIDIVDDAVVVQSKR